MWEKIRVVFTIPELRKKILLHAVVPGRLSRRLVDSAADHRSGSRWLHLTSAEHAASGVLVPAGGHVQRHASSTRSRSSAWASCPIFRPRLSSSCWPASGRRWSGCRKKAKAGRKKINEYTRYATVVLVHRAKLGLCAAAWSSSELVEPEFLNGDGLSFGWQLVAVHDDDRRHRVPDVAGRADRRVRHRQRHQLVDHGRHSGRHAGRRLLQLLQQSTASSWPAAAARLGLETLIVLVMLFVAVVAAWCLSR